MDALTSPPLSPTVQCNTAGLSLTEELLYVHKVQAIVEFCGECKKLLKAFKLEIINPEGIELSCVDTCTCSLGVLCCFALFVC